MPAAVSELDREISATSGSMASIRQRRAGRRTILRSMLKLYVRPPAPSLRQLIKQRLGFFEVGSVESFREPAVNRRKEIRSPAAVAPSSPQSSSNRLNESLKAAPSPPCCQDARSSRP
jgi:hypothetical protein